MVKATHTRSSKSNSKSNSDHNIVAMIIMQKNDGHVLFHKFCAQQGYGAKLLNKMEQKAKQQGFTNMRVEVFSPAIKLFRVVSFFSWDTSKSDQVCNFPL